MLAPRRRRGRRLQRRVRGRRRGPPSCEHTGTSSRLRGDHSVQRPSNGGTGAGNGGAQGGGDEGAGRSSQAATSVPAARPRGRAAVPCPQCLGPRLCGELGSAGGPGVVQPEGRGAGLIRVGLGLGEEASGGAGGQAAWEFGSRSSLK